VILGSLLARPWVPFASVSCGARSGTVVALALTSAVFLACRPRIRVSGSQAFGQGTGVDPEAAAAAGRRGHDLPGVLPGPAVYLEAAHYRCRLERELRFGIEAEDVSGWMIDERRLPASLGRAAPGLPADQAGQL